jgi:hypothetical protein
MEAVDLDVGVFTGGVFEEEQAAEEGVDGVPFSGFGGDELRAPANKDTAPFDGMDPVLITGDGFDAAVEGAVLDDVEHGLVEAGDGLPGDGVTGDPPALEGEQELGLGDAEPMGGGVAELIVGTVPIDPPGIDGCGDLVRIEGGGRRIMLGAALVVLGGLEELSLAGSDLGSGGEFPLGVFELEGVGGGEAGEVVGGEDGVGIDEWDDVVRHRGRRGRRQDSPLYEFRGVQAVGFNNDSDSTAALVFRRRGGGCGGNHRGGESGV